MNRDNWFNQFSSLMDQNIKGVQYGVYAVAGIGLLTALRSVRPFLKFRRPNDVPHHFIQKHMRFRGKVVGFQGGQNPLLKVDHYPVVTLPIIKSGENTLPVQISSIDVTQNGSIWISHVLNGSEVSFTPLRAESNRLHAIIYHKNYDVGQHLVSIGFATVGGLDFELEKDVLYSKYYRALLAAERKAEWKGAGLWQGTQTRYQRFRNRLFAIRHSIPLSLI